MANDDDATSLSSPFHVMTIARCRHYHLLLIPRAIPARLLLQQKTAWLNTTIAMQALRFIVHFFIYKRAHKSLSSKHENELHEHRHQ